MDETVEGLFFADLNLDVDWQREHFIKEATTRRSFRTDDVVRKRYPGLGTRYANAEVKVRVKDPSHAQCAVFGLSEGRNVTSIENTSQTNKERFFARGIPDRQPDGEEGMGPLADIAECETEEEDSDRT